MNRFVCFGIILSLFIHLTLYVFLKKQNTPIAEVREPLFIEWAASNTSAEPQQNSKKSHRKTIKKNGHLSKLLHSSFGDMAREVYGQKKSSGESIQDIEVSSGDTVIDLQKTIDNDRLLPRIWRQIRAHASYRPEHIRERIQGVVQVRVRLGRRGELLRIFEESMTGPRELQGWVLLFLIEALQKPFLSEKLPAIKTLDLRFYFSMSQEFPPSQTNRERMIFPIDGSLPLHVQMAQNAQDMFADEKLKNASVWSFYERLSIYEKACEHRNPAGCQKVKEMKRFVAK